MEDEWVELRVFINLSADYQTIYYNGSPLLQKSWTDGVSGGGALNIACLDLFAHTQVSWAAYYDDFVLQPTEGTPTPVPPITATPTSPVKTPTPVPTLDKYCEILGVSLWMPSHYYEPGDTVKCEIITCNPGTEILTDVPLFAILDVYGLYYFAPSFTDFDHFNIDLYPNTFQLISVFPEFRWPSGAGTASNILWYSAMTDQDFSALLGELDIWEFGWGE